MSANNMITANGKIFFLEEREVGKPFIYRGNLNDAELREWLFNVAGALDVKDSSTAIIEELALEIERIKRKEAKRNEIISTSVYPKAPDPIHCYDIQNSDKQASRNRSHEN